MANKYREFFFLISKPPPPNAYKTQNKVFSFLKKNTIV